MEANNIRGKRYTINSLYVGTSTDFTVNSGVIRLSAAGTVESGL